MLNSFISTHLRKSLWALTSIIVVLLLSWILKDKEPRILLWQIGKADQNNLEFALSPNQYKEFKKDGLFVVGQSDCRTDWPYVHPGPEDLWADKRQHTFRIFFGTNSLSKKGQCRLKVKLIDTHRHNLPDLSVVINGKIFKKTLPSGAGDASLEGRPDKGKPYQLNISFDYKSEHHLFSDVI